MYTTYHLSSAQEVNTDILDAIKATFKSRPIVEEDIDDFELSGELQAILDKRLLEDDTDYLTAQESIDQLKTKYGL